MRYIYIYITKLKSGLTPGDRRYILVAIYLRKRTEAKSRIDPVTPEFRCVSLHSCSPSSGLCPHVCLISKYIRKSASVWSKVDYSWSIAMSDVFLSNINLFSVVPSSGFFYFQKTCSSSSKLVAALVPRGCKILYASLWPVERTEWILWREFIIRNNNYHRKPRNFIIS